MFHIVHTLDFPPSLDVAIMKLEPGQTIMALYRVSQKKLSLVKISCGKYNSGWWEIQ